MNQEDLKLKFALKKISKKAAKEYKKLFREKSHQYGEYKDIHDAIMQLSFVKDLVKENKNLKLVINYYVKKNIALKSRLKDLAGENDEHISLKIEETDPVLNESLDKMYEILGEKGENANLKDSVEESESSEIEEEEVEEEEAEEEEAQEEEAEEEEEKADSEAEEEEDKTDSEAEEDDASCETETKDKTESEIAESEIADSEIAESEEEEEEEFFEIVIKKVTYCTNNETNGDIYLMENDEMGDKVGYFKNGKPVFTKK
jgi:regulator of protease activity HflC (stomatin/prohibitin superfamily)